MTLEEFKDVLQLNKLAKSWLDEYSKNNLGAHSSKLKKQFKEMQSLKAQTDTLIDRQSGEAGGEADNWQELYEDIQKLAKTSPVFAPCFGEANDLLSDGSPVSKEAGMLAIKLKKMTSAWVGRFEDEVQDNNAKELIMTIYEQAKKVLAAPKNADGDMVVLEFYGSKTKRCRKMRKKLEFIAAENEGMVDVVMHLIKDEDGVMHKLGIENLPAIIFKRGKKQIAKHEGDLSISAVQSKLGAIMDGASISDSSSVPSIKELKKINGKELYSLGEYLLFYFTLPNCGICNKTDEVVNKIGNSYSKIKFESVMVDGSHSLHKSFGVTHVPSLVFVRLGKVIGKHVGYINPSNFEEKMDKFASSTKTKMGLSENGESMVIPGEEEKEEKV